MATAISKQVLSVWGVFSIILLEGFVTISVEILVIRQLLPFVGNSVIVTSLIIGVFLLFLALGYRRGGVHSAQFLTVLRNNFMMALGLLGVGISYAFVGVFFQGMQSYVASHVLIQLTLYLLLIVAPLVYVLGQTVPITTHFFQQQLGVGAISARVLYLSTLGSFLGAVLTSLILFSYLGVAYTVWVNACILGGLIALLNHALADNGRSVFVLVALGLVYYLNVGFEQQRFVRTNNYGNYRVQAPFVLTQHNVGKALIINNSLSSFINEQKKAAPYLEMIKKVLFDDLKLRGRSILVLGAGGFTFGAQNAHGNHIHYLDIDQDLKRIVEAHYLTPVTGTFTGADARVFVKRTQNAYDVILSDAYHSRIAIPAYLLTIEHMRHVRDALREEGVAIFNVIARPFLNDPYSARVDNTISAVFPHCMKIPQFYVAKLSNILYVCRKSPYDRTVYTDDKNRAAWDFFQLMQLRHTG